MIIFRWIVCRIRNVSDGSCKNNQNTYFIFNKFFWISCRLWGNVEKHGTARQVTDEDITLRMHIACWITKTTNTHSEYVIFIALPLQRWSRERSWIIIIIIIIIINCNWVVIWCNWLFYMYTKYEIGDRCSTVVKVLCYKSEGRWFDPSWCLDFSLIKNPGVDSASNRNEYQEYFLGVKAACA